MAIDRNKFQISRWPFIKMRLRPLRPLRRQRPIVEQPLQRQNPAAPLVLERQRLTAPQLLQRQKPTVLLILEKQSPAVWIMPVSSNNHMQRVCNIWKWKPWKRRGEAASPS